MDIIDVAQAEVSLWVAQRECVEWCEIWGHVKCSRNVSGVCRDAAVGLFLFAVMWQSRITSEA